MSEADTRTGSRLEVDDPDHCKWCGADIGDVTAHVDVELCASCAANRTTLKANAVKQAKENHGESVHPKKLDDPPENWDLSDELWYSWSAEVRAQYKSTEGNDGE